MKYSQVLKNLPHWWYHTSPQWQDTLVPFFSSFFFSDYMRLHGVLFFVSLRVYRKHVAWIILHNTPSALWNIITENCLEVPVPGGSQCRRSRERRFMWVDKSDAWGSATDAKCSSWNRSKQKFCVNIKTDESQSDVVMFTS